MLKKIISGAQTGADRAGLVAAIDLGIQNGGTVPKGRRTDTGPLSDYEMARYNLQESKYNTYPPRTRQNVSDSDGTAIFGNVGSPGSRLTLKYCRDLCKPHIINPEPSELRAWAEKESIETLNVAGNRERSNPGIYRRVLVILVQAFQ